MLNWIKKEFSGVGEIPFGLNKNSPDVFSMIGVVPKSAYQEPEKKPVRFVPSFGRTQTSRTTPAVSQDYIDKSRTMEFPITEGGKKYISQVGEVSQPSFLKTGLRGTSEKMAYNRRYTETDEIIKRQQALESAGLNRKKAQEVATEITLHPFSNKSAEFQFTSKELNQKQRDALSKLETEKIVSMAIGFIGGGIKFVSPEVANKIIANAVKSQITRSDLLKITAGKLKSGIKYDTYRTMAADPTMRKELSAIAKNKKIPAKTRIADYFKKFLKPAPANVGLRKELQPLATGAKKYKSAEEFFEKMPVKTRDVLMEQGIKGKEAIINFWNSNAEKVVRKIDSLNPTGSLHVNYTPQERMTLKLGENMTTLDKTSGKSPNEIITIYRGAPKIQKEIVPGDFITTNYKLAKSYTGEENVLSKEVKMSDILDDKTEPLGEEYIYRPITQVTKEVKPETKPINPIVKKAINDRIMSGPNEIGSVKPVDMTHNIDRIIQKWYGDTLKADYLASERMKTIKKLKVKNAITPDREKLLAWAIQQPKKYGNQLSIGEKEIGNFVKKHFDKLHDIAKKEGVLDAYRENYLTQLYKDDPKKTLKLIYPTGGKKLGTKFRFGLKRKILNMEEAEKAGLHPIYNLETIVGAYNRSLGRTIANKRIVTTLKSLNGKDGRPLIAQLKNAPKDYVYLDEPAFTRYLGGKSKNGKTLLFRAPGVKVHPEIAKSLKAILSPYSSVGKWQGAYLTLRGGIKRAIMYNPLIHGWNIYSDVLDEVNFNLIKAARIVAKGPNAKDLTKLGSIEKVEREMAKNGIELGQIWNSINELREGLGKTTRKIPVFSGLKSVSDKILWGNIVGNSQKSIYILKKAQFLKKGLGEETAQRLAAHYTNDLLGTLPKILFSKNEQQTLNALFFARNWTISNLRLVTGATGLTPETKVLGKMFPKFLLHSGLSKNEMKALRGEYQKHLLKGILALLVSTNAINKAVTGHWSFENEEGHRIDIDTGLKDKQGREIYITNPLFRYIRDYAGWTTAPSKTVWNKLEPLLKQGIEQVINYSVWQKKPIAGQGLPIGKQLEKRIEYTLKGTTPLGSLAPREGESRGWLEALMPLTGTWIRHGVRGGDFGLKIIKFQQKSATQKKEIDNKIDKLLQEGKTGDAIKEMIKVHRYSSKQPFMDRLLKYKIPLIQRYKGMSKEERLRFFIELNSEQKKEFIKAMVDEQIK